MKIFRNGLAVALILLALGCSFFEGDSDSDSEINDDLSLVIPDALLVDSKGSKKINLKLNLQSQSDLYFVFTNANAAARVDAEDYSVSSSDIAFSQNLNLLMSKSSAGFRSNFVDPVLPAVGKLSKADRKLAKNILKSSVMASASVGEFEKFWEVAEGVRQVASHCRKIVSNVTTKFGQKTLNIWVADNCWHSGGSKPKLITQDMVDTMAEKFLKSGENNDIYDWVTNICGKEWGEHKYSNLIGDNQPIDILLCDIEDDNETTGGVLGYFWSGNCFTTATETYSNQRVMFYIDALIYANADDGDSGWKVDDPYPREMISTLAHEFQHMINFYQLVVLRDVYEATWLNEMLSMSIEDLVAYNIYGNYYSSPYYSRFVELNENDDYSLGRWESDTRYYAINYGFGSYLLRQFDGANFVKEIYDQGKSSTDAIEQATGGNFVTLMRNWAAAYLLSDKSVSSGDFDYNADTTSSLNGVDYSLVNIDAYAFQNSEPKVFSLNDIEYIKPLANKYYLVKEGLPAGSYSFEIMMQDEDLRLTVVAK